MRTKSEWYRTGECRIVPSWFGFMRAEFFERRDFKDETGEVMEYQMRTVRAGPLPAQFDGPSAFGFWSTMSTPAQDERYGDRSLWRQFISYFPKIKK